MNESKQGWRILRRPPDVTEGESSYSTAFYMDKDYPIVGYGFTPEAADTAAIEKLIDLLLKIYHSSHVQDYI